MIDFIKLLYNDKRSIEAFIEGSKTFMNISQNLNIKTGLIGYPKKTTLKSMSVVISENSAYVRNSIHRLYNVIHSQEEHNHNSFTYSMLCDTIKFLHENLIDLAIAQVQQLEFGLNITTEIPPEEIIRRNVLMHKFKNYNHNVKYYGNTKAELKQYDYYNYFIKVYDKGKAFQLEEYILRFEIKLMKKRDIQNIGINSIFDLADKMKLRKLFLLLIKHYDEMIIVDEFYANTTITVDDRNKLNNYRNSIFWEEEIRGKSRQTKAYHKKQFQRILEKYNLLNNKKYLRNQLVEKFIFLMNN